MPAPIITLTTDLGNKDYYLPSVKGVLLSKLPAANIVDITHEISPFNIAEASFILKGCFNDFPPDTIHIVSVDADDNQQQRYLLLRCMDRYLVAPDNGLASLVLEEQEPEWILELPFQPADLVFPLKNIMAPAAIRLAGQMPELDGLGTLTKNYRRKANLRPVTEDDFIRGMVTYIDNMGNAITNIELGLFSRYAGRRFNIYISRKEYFETISRHYNEVQEGEKLCLFGTGGYMEIAINKGNGSSLLGLKPGHPILIEFISDDKDSKNALPPGRNRQLS